MISLIVETVITGRTVTNFLHIVRRKMKIVLRSQCAIVGALKNDLTTSQYGQIVEQTKYEFRR